MNKKHSRISLRRKIAIGAGGGIVALGFWASQAFYTVKTVIDGDTFITSQNRIVRLDSVNAPELKYCLGAEAKQELEKLVTGKKVFLKVTYIDSYNRLVASVFTVKGNVGAAMLAKGLATFKSKGNQEQPNLLKTSQDARNKKLGIFSDKCTQLSNPSKPDCDIKGNVKDGAKTYRIPLCANYKLTDVQLYLGDQWFCTEKEAINEGFTKASDCN